MEKFKKIPNFWFTRIEQQSIRGTPDLIGCLNGFFVAIEFKRSKSSKPTKLQDHVLGLIRKAGGMSFVVYPENFDDVYKFLISLGGKNEESCSNL